MRTKNKDRYVWLLLVRKETRDPRVPDFGNVRPQYRIVKTAGTAEPYLGFRLVGAFSTQEEAVAMRKLAEG